MKKIWLVAVVLLLAVTGASAQDRVEWSAKGPEHALKPGEKFEITLTAKIDEGWHMYSFTQPPGGPTTATVSLHGKRPFKLAGAIHQPAPHKFYDPNFEMETEIFEGSPEFSLPLVAGSDATPATKAVAVDVRFQLCDETTCLPPKTVLLSVPVKIAAVKSIAAAAPTQYEFPAGTTPQAQAAVPPVVSQQEKPASITAAPAKQSPVSKQPFGSFLWLAAVMGALSLLTPCVFPMIPITVSYFTNHSGKSRKSAIVTALIYGGGIILTFTALGMLLAVIFGAGGVNQLAANPWVNLLITAIFLGFAFSLFGAYFIQVPPELMNKLDGITRSKEGSQVIGALLMGFTFTLTSFTCTAPFVGTLLVMTAQGNWRWPLAGMLVFSTVFAIPFVVLALMPQLISALPKAGGWMNSVKVVMGFLEIAAAMKFLSNADLVWRWGVFTRQTVLAIWVGIGVLTVLYILGYFRMAHDSPVESVGATRITFAIIVLAVTVWLVPGLFGRQLGELESFLPPEVGSSVPPGGIQPVSSSSLHGEAGWILNDYDQALAKAKQENKLVFVDFTGYTCTNCRWMEANMFPRPDVSREMDKFVRVRLYTDGDGEVFERQQKMQQERFGTVALPYYAILQSDGSTVKTFPGLTRNANEFVSFLRAPDGKDQ